jgi:hypothetical protein
MIGRHGGFALVPFTSKPGLLGQTYTWPGKPGFVFRFGALHAPV